MRAATIVRTFLGKTPAARHTRLALLAGGGILIGAIAYFRDAEPAIVPVQASHAVAAATQFGPGVWVEQHSQADVVSMDTEPPDGLAFGPDRRLIVNVALRRIFDYFLLSGHPGDRQQHITQLRAYLKKRLPATAFQEAVELVEKYVLYLEQHDKLLVQKASSSHRGVPPSQPDVDSIAAWFATRTRLRQTILGMTVATIWFGEDEARDQRNLQALRDPGSAAAAESDPTQRALNTLNAYRASGTPYATQREFVAQQFGEEAARRFDKMEQEEQAWQNRYRPYRDKVDQITAQTGMAESERMRQIESLRVSTFPNEPEKILASTLDMMPREKALRQGTFN